MSGVEQARVGAKLEPFVVESVDAEKMKIMAAILQDPNPIHFDIDAVRKLGLGDRPVNQGPINMAYLMNVAAAWAGGPEALRRFQVRFAGNVFAGDRVECSGTVTALDPSTGIAELELTAKAGDAVVLTGSATVALRR